MQGQAGKCPHCGVRFRVPQMSDSAGEQLELATASTSTTSAIGGNQDIHMHGGLADLSPLTRDEPGASDVLNSSIGVPKAVQAGNTMISSATPSRLLEEFIALWDSKTPQSTFEIHLPEGEVIVPTEFSVQKSNSEFGFFGRNDGGRIQVHIIPWRSVSRIVISGLSDLSF